MGFADSLVRGRLAKLSGIYDGPTDRLYRISSRIRKEADERILEIERAAEQEILEQLTTEQREKVVSMLVDTIGFQERLESHKMYQKL